MIDPRIKDRIYAHVPLPVLRRVLPVLAAGKTPFLPEIVARRVIFIHVPKAAGSSLKEQIYGARMGGHRRIVEFAAYDAEKTRDFFKCAFVRNPWDRLLSAYTFLVQGRDTSARDNRFARAHLARHADFRAFVRELGEPGTRDVVMRYDHFRPQRHWICMPGEAGHAMDFLGRFETMQADLARLFERLDRPAPAPKSSRTSNHRPYTEEYDDETRAIAADLYAGDIALLGYGFEGFAPSGDQASTV